MIKILTKFTFFIVFLVMLTTPINAYAAEVSGTITGDGVRIRNSASTSGSIITEMHYGTKITITNANAGSGNGCASPWFQIKYNGASAYVCSEYAKIDEVTNSSCALTTDTYEKELCNKGFPYNYVTKLKALHLLHPTWEFTPVETNLDFAKQVGVQAVLGRSLIYKDSPEGYRSVEPGVYNYVTDTFSRHPTEVNWWYANEEIIAYYLDPRNFLNEISIFQFEKLNFESSYQNRRVIEKLFGNTFVASVYASYNNASKLLTDPKYQISSILSDDIIALKNEDENIMSDDYVRALLKAAAKYNISPVHLVTRMLQEVGTTEGTASSGKSFEYGGKTYSGLYNFYNVGASGANPAIAGLIWANGGTDGTATGYLRPWDSPYRSIVGGADFLVRDYIGMGQYTSYFQKWDTSPTSTASYLHQYMQNISAPTSEASKTYNGYKQISGLLDEAFSFAIPIYKNMNDKAYELPNPGNPNPYLKDLKVNGNTVDNFNYDKLSYNISVPAGTTNVNITGITINSNAKISGAGTINLSTNVTDTNIIVTAQNGTTKTYTIKITREDDTKIPLDTIINASGIKYNGDIIAGIKPGTNVDSLINNVKAISAYAKAIIKDKDKNIKNNDLFRTGDIVTISNGQDEKTFTVIIYGDTDGSGEIDKIDMLLVQRHIYGYSTLTKEYYSAADVNKDGYVDKIDLVEVQRHIYGYSTISQ